MSHLDLTFAVELVLVICANCCYNPFHSLTHSVTLGGCRLSQPRTQHLACLTKLRNRHRYLLRANQESSSCYTEENQKKARAFTELVTFIESAVEDGTFYFKLADLRHLFEKRLKEFGIDNEVNKARFKENFLSHFHEAQAQNDGKNIVLISSKECSNF